MRPRLLLLFAVAACSCLSAVAVANARSEKPRRPSARIPAIPVARATSTHRCPIPKQYRAAFVAAANDTNLPLALLTAVAQVESQFDSGATSAAGARGLLQLMPTTAAELKLDADRPDTNVLAGARYLKGLLDRFNSTDLALAAYNAGPTAVAKAGGAPNDESLTYVANVTQIWRLLHGCA
jgi:soluble lytic murein transglycosylase-like protein